MIRRVYSNVATTVISAILFTTIVVSSVTAQTSLTTTLAGKTVGQYAAELGDSDRTIRLRAARSLASMGQPAGKALTETLNHDDPAVRYIAATGLGRIGGKSLSLAKEPLEKLAADERSRAAQMAASFALCCAGQTSEHLSILVDALSSPERGIVCASAELLGDIGPPAKEAVPTLKKIHAKNKSGVKGGDYHIGGAAMNALRKIDPENFR